MERCLKARRGGGIRNTGPEIFGGVPRLLPYSRRAHQTPVPHCTLSLSPLRRWCGRDKWTRGESPAQITLGWTFYLEPRGWFGMGRDMIGDWEVGVWQGEIGSWWDLFSSEEKRRKGGDILLTPSSPFFHTREYSPPNKHTAPPILNADK